MHHHPDCEERTTLVDEKLQQAVVITFPLYCSRWMPLSGIAIAQSMGRSEYDPSHEEETRMRR